MSDQSSSSTSAVVIIMVMMIIMCCCCGLSSSSYEPLCDSNDPSGLCKGSGKTGRCNPDNFAGGARFQAAVIDRLGMDYYHKGTVSGCQKMETGAAPVYTYYCCSGTVSACEDCYADALRRLRDGCAGRAGGSVLFDQCSLRYETYDFCNMNI